MRTLELNFSFGEDGCSIILDQLQLFVLTFRQTGEDKIAVSNSS